MVGGDLAAGLPGYHFASGETRKSGAYDLRENHGFLQPRTDVRRQKKYGAEFPLGERGKICKNRKKRAVSFFRALDRRLTGIFIIKTAQKCR